VTLDVDLSRPIRSLAEQVALIKAVASASAAETEKDWIEWKSEVDLAELAWQSTVARHVLGFANRDPDLAASAAHGCSYVLLGVEPGRILGTKAYDPADIDQWVRAFLGTGRDSPVWRPEYIGVDGMTVLLVSIEPPAWGDPIHTLKKQSWIDHAPAGRGP